MSIEKKLGIWIDHLSAHLMEWSNNAVEVKAFDAINTEPIEAAPQNNNQQQNGDVEEHKQAAFYKRLSDAVRHYNEVLIFGPTDAKVKLLNLLKEDNSFEHIKIASQQTDRMTEHQQNAFVQEYFSKH